MAQEWDEKNEQQNGEELEWVGNILNLDENMKKQLMEKVTNFLEKNNIDFKVEGNKIMIKGLAVYFEPASYMNGVQKIEIIDGDKKILWETDMSENKISVGTIGTPGYTDSVELPRETYANYNLPYLTIMV